MEAVALDRITKIYNVDDVCLKIDPGELLVLLGPSGCGKTAILRIIAGLEEPTSGDLWLGGQLVDGLRLCERNVAMVFQDGALYPHLTVRDNLGFPLVAARQKGKPAIDARVREVAYGLGIESTLDRRPGLLSGGERQRVAIGRALIRGHPAVLLMDEPLASLDVALRGGLRAEIGSLVRSLGITTTVYVTHDQAEALSLAERIAVLRNGRVEDTGTPARVYREPATAFTAAFLGSPPISLTSATVRAVNGSRVVIDFGRQRHDVPWKHPHCEALTYCHGQRVIVGIRPEALTPSSVSSAAGGGLLRGTISSLEYHGHEWLARLEVGFRPVDLDMVNTRPLRPDPQASGQADWRALYAAEERLAAANGPGGHRGASLLVRLDSPHGWTQGQEVSVSVDLASIFAFDAEGKRLQLTPG